MAIDSIFHAKYKTRGIGRFRGFSHIDKLVRLYMRTGIDIYPHQIVAALAAMEDPLRPGFILADEVGLGKGHEAMLVVSQYCLDGKKVLIIAPTPLVSDWHERVRQFGLNEPDDENQVQMISYDEAVKNANALKGQGFDLVVLEEAHRLRKFHEGDNKTANTLHNAFRGVQKLLLTATPILKNVMDLYGLIEFIYPGYLGDAKQFYQAYYKRPENYAHLSKLIHPYIFRTLRSQVRADVNLPERNILTYQYELSAKEQELEKKLTRYLAKPKKVAFPDMDNYELSLMLGKALSSSVDALAKTLSGVVARLGKIQADDARRELAEIKSMLMLAKDIGIQSKGDVFIKALKGAFSGFHGRQIKKKAIVFTESVETQKYIATLLQEKTKYKVAVYNGSTGNEPLEQFRGKDAQILVATDNASEGFDFAFCNLVINYDNPWSISTLEQRIGRVHRIGQKNDVVVINFLCTELLADVRFYELVFKRLNMVDGILGATDNVVGAVAKGDIETRISETIAATRNATQTSADFVDLTAGIQKELEERKESANELMFRSFDEDIAQKTKNYAQVVRERGNQLRDLLWELAQYIFKGYGRFEVEDNKRRLYLEKQVFRARQWNRRVYEFDFDRTTLQGDRFTFGNRLVREMFDRIHNQNKFEGGRVTLTDETMRGLRGKLALITVSLTDDRWNSVYKTMLVGHDWNDTELDEPTLERIMSLPCAKYETDRRVEWYAEIPEPESITPLKDKRLPAIVDELKADFNDVISTGRKRISLEFDKSRKGLKDEIDEVERELATLNRAKDKREGDPFALDQKIATLSKQLSKLRENEFMTKLRLKKDEEQALSDFMAMFNFKVKTSVDFVVDFEIN